uniref:Transmembrane protein n=1 Tax=Macrostomum lignano TaxID=282301 RepID=A0A1I8FH73_9PLAT
MRMAQEFSCSPTAANVLKGRSIQHCVTPGGPARSTRGGRPALLSCEGVEKMPRSRKRFISFTFARLGLVRRVASCNYRWLQSLRTIVGCSLAPAIQFAATSVRRLPQKAAGRLQLFRSFSNAENFTRLFLCAVCFDWPVFHGSQTEARQTSSAMPASDSEPQRQVVYEPCVRPSELLRRQRLPTEASAEQAPPAAGPRLGSLSWGLDCCDAGDGASSAMLFLFVKAFILPLTAAPSRWHQCQSCRSHRRRRLPSRLHPQPRGFCSSSAGGSRLRDSRGRAAVAAACSHRCLLRPSRHPLRRRRDQRRRQEALCAGKRAHFGANSISRLSRLQLREGRVLLARAPVEAGAPAGAHPGAADLLREEAERQQQDEQQRAEHPAGVRGLRLVNTPSQTVLLPASEASSLPVRAAASAALLTICRLTAPRLRSTARSAFSCNLPLTCTAQLSASPGTCSALSFTWHCSALSFTLALLWLHCTALFASATVAPAVAVPAAQKPPGVGVAQRLGLSSRRQVGVGGVSQRPRPESPSQRPAQK